jgi:hypothetical protein
MPQPKLYSFSTTIGAACASQFPTFQDLAERLNADAPVPILSLISKRNHRVDTNGSPRRHDAYED